MVYICIWYIYIYGIYTNLYNGYTYNVDYTCRTRYDVHCTTYDNVQTTSNKCIEI